MRVAACIALLASCLALTGCGLLGKRSAAPSNGPRPSLDTNPPAPAPVFPGQGGGTAAVPTSAGSGILAGQVLDGYQRKPPPAYIQVSQVREGNQPAAAPLEVATDNQGYFTIQGLQPGRHYQLIARARDGEQLLAGTTYAMPPNPRVVIRISAEFAGSHTPQVPPPPALPSGPKASNNPGAPPPAWPTDHGRADQGWAPGRGAPANPDPRRPAGLGAPIGIDEPAVPPTNPNIPVTPERIGSGPPTARRDQQPANIRGPGSPAPDWTPAEQPPAPAENPNQAPIPFCSLTGRQLHNFGLYDLNGKTWEFRQRRNKLTLLEFWGTWCIFCQHSIPHLNILQQKYGQHGLEVVGIAYENGPVEKHAEQVRMVAERLKINYTLLLGGDRLRCPVRSQFRVASWPTFFLIDADGRLIWQEAGLDKQKVVELERLIRQQLGVR